MTEIDPKNLEQMKRFLFYEMAGAERESVEERFFSDEDLFYDLMELENSLVDAYARRELTGEDLERFEASLEKSPERRGKIANAAALASLIKEEKQTAEKPAAVVETPPTLWEKIASFFTLQMPLMQYASALLILALAGGTAFLLYERFRLNQELADLQDKQKSVEELQKQEQNLQKQLNEIREREKNLQNQIGEKQGESEILNQQLERERSERERLENDLDRLKDLQKNLPRTDRRPAQMPKPTIASVVLSPFLGGRGGENARVANDAKTIKLDPNIKSVTATLQLPKDARAEVFLVRFKGQTVSAKQKPRTTGSGVRFVTVTLPAARLSTEEENVITVTGSDGVSYDFLFNVQK